MTDEYQEPRLYEVKVHDRIVGRYELLDDAMAVKRLEKDRNPNLHVSVVDWRGRSVGRD
jgi:hypothetical protein